jgi:hypothetical protein
MSLDSLLAVAGLLVAVFALLPRPRQLDIRLRLGPLDWTVICAAIALVHYLLFFPLFAGWGLSPRLNLVRWGLTPTDMAYVVLVGAAVFVGLHVRRVRLTPRTLPRFCKLAQELLWTKNFNDLAILVEQHFDSLLLLAAKHNANQEHDNLSRGTGIALASKNVSLFQRIRTRLALVAGSVAGRISSLTISRLDQPEARAADFIHGIFTSSEFVDYVAKNRPYLGITVIRKHFPERADFLNMYLRSLLSDSSSILFYEIRNTDEANQDGLYKLQKGGRLLTAIFGKPGFAQEQEVYRPAGDFVCERLDVLSFASAQDPYNAPLLDFDESTHWKDPLWVSVRFFDIMVLHALQQGIQWHMWLYYMTHFTDKISKNYKIDLGSERASEEFPNRYSYLLYEMFDAMRRWVLAVKCIDSSQPNVQLKNTTSENENGNIPKSAIIALAQSLKRVLGNTAVPEGFRRYLLEVVIDTYACLKGAAGGAGYATVILAALGKCESYECQDVQEYFSQLKIGLENFRRSHLRSGQDGELQAFVKKLQGE